MLWFRVTASLSLLLCVVAWFAFRPDLVVVDRVEFVGMHRASPQALRHFANFENGTTLWSADVLKVAEGVQRHPWVRSASAEKFLNGRLVITVREHEPMAIVALPNGLFYVDAFGEAFLPASTDYLDLPIITGLFDASDPDSRVTELAFRDALWLLDHLDDEQLVPRHMISEVGWSPFRGWTIRIRGAGPGKQEARLLFALGDYEAQLDKLRIALLRPDVDFNHSIEVDLGVKGRAIIRKLALSTSLSCSRSPLDPLASYDAPCASLLAVHSSHRDPSFRSNPWRIQ
ncbi:MAG: cell division protein FtsQ/DivIB [Myxococcota bacterium]